jgi:hypothetical protein
MMPDRELKVVTPVSGTAPDIGRWLWAMEETRRGLLHTVEGLEQPALDWPGPSGTDNSIGSLLYHLALIEMSWLYGDVLLEPAPPEVESLFPREHRTVDRRLTHVAGEPLTQHMERLRLTRARFLERMAAMTVADWDTVREPADVNYACSPAWVVFHLVEHEAGHVFQIREIKRRWREEAGSN